MRPRLLAPSLITLGFLLALTAAMLPGDARWIHADQARHEHVTTLSRDGNGQLHAGTQSGRLWRLTDGANWQDASGTPGAVAITVMRAHGDGLLVGTSDGLFHWQGDWEELRASGRISDARALDRESTGTLLVATGNRVLALREGRWEDTRIADAIGDSPVYRVKAQPTDTGTVLHAGTVGSGVWARLPGQDVWQHNSQALPEGVNVFALTLADNGVLLAGTDQGLYWQAAPLQPWRHLDAGLGTRRVLDLARWEHPDNRTRLLAASDDGVHAARLVERARSLEIQGRWQPVEAGPQGLDGPVSWIVPAEETVWISAGSVYQLARYRPALWYVALASGGVMVLAGLYMIVTGRRRGYGHASL